MTIVEVEDVREAGEERFSCRFGLRRDCLRRRAHPLSEARERALDAVRDGVGRKLRHLAVAVADVRTFTIDTAGWGAVLPNTSQMLTAWTVPKVRAPQSVRNGEWDVRDFAEWVEIMAATGGNASRDCYRDPQNRAVTDDYDFLALVEGCRGIVALGMKPYLKLGNVPMKLSTNIANGDFMMNVRPPDDYAEYVRYMEACARALLAAFGKEELLKWRFAVLTEYENDGWFQDASGDPERTFQAYCLLYEKTVEAFARVVSPDLTFGAHAMAVTEGLWDERRLSVVAEGGDRPDLETEAVAAIAEDGRRIQIMAYSFTNDLHAAGTVRVRCAVKCPAAWLGKDLSLTRRIVDDRANWFPQWRKDRKELGLSDDRFRWSPDDPAVLGGMGLIEAADRAKFQETLLPRYRVMARLEAQTRTVTLKDEKPFAIEEEMQVNLAIFLELQLR